MDRSSVRKMQEIPQPQRALGWQFVPRESRPYVAAYTRPYTPHADDRDFIQLRGVVHDGAVWVFINLREFANWDEVRQAAIETMVEIDMQRTPREVSNRTPDTGHTDC